MKFQRTLEPLWKRNPFYRALRRSKSAIRSRIEGARLQKRVERENFRLVPERELEACYRNAIRILKMEGEEAALGSYLEFGVCHGSSMACMHRVANEMALHDMRFLGFDSFEGLPEEADRPGEGTWRPGEYRSDIAFTRRFLTQASVDWVRTTLVKGWFKDTLTQETRIEHGIEKASIIMVDCDIYSSARLALDFCEPLIRDQAVILFDDWNAADLAAQGMGEKLAFDEFLGANPQLRAEPLPPYTANAAVFLLRRAKQKVGAALTAFLSIFLPQHYIASLEIALVAA